MATKLDLTNMNFGYLHVIREATGKEKGNRKGRYWVCSCRCGNTTVVLTNRLTSGITQSCGCKKHETHNRRHGMTGKDLHLKWSQMRQRCNNTGANSYPQYGGSGIKVCKEWDDSFETFRDWSFANGYKPGLSLDRKDNSKGYSPDNCRWVTWKEQCNNRRNNVLISHNGEEKTLKQWCEKLGLKYNLIYQRIKRDGYTFEQAISSKPYEFRRTGK